MSAREQQVEERFVEVSQRAANAKCQLEQAQPMLEQLQATASKMSGESQSRYGAAPGLSNISHAALAPPEQIGIVSTG